MKLTCCLLLLSFSSSEVLTVAAPAQYHFIQEIPIGGEGGWDYLSVDSAGHRLYVSHGTKVVSVDLLKNQVAGEIAETPGVHGFAIAPELGRGFASNGREAKASIVDPQTHRIYLAAADFEPQSQQKAGEPRQRPKMVAATFKVLVYGISEDTDHAK